MEESHTHSIHFKTGGHRPQGHFIKKDPPPKKLLIDFSGEINKIFKQLSQIANFSLPISIERSIKHQKKYLEDYLGYYYLFASSQEIAPLFPPLKY